MNQKRPSSPSAEAQRIRRVLQQRRQKRRRYWLLIALELILIVVLLVVFVARNVSREPTDGTQTSANNNGEVLQTSDTGETTQTDDAVQEPAEETVPEVTFQVDLSAYEPYMNPENRDDYLILVNREEGFLTADDVPTDLVTVVNARSDRTVYMREIAEKALEALFLEAEAEGMTYVNPNSGVYLSVMSGYRSYETQKNLYMSYVRQEMANRGCSEEEAKAYAARYSNPEGTSEHQTGLCCDMHNLSSADQSFQYQDAAKWLAENCWKFGFILRYPADKEDITGTSYEPWHFRYVGRYHAYFIHRDGLCLEEYLEQREQNG